MPNCGTSSSSRWRWPCVAARPPAGGGEVDAGRLAERQQLRARRQRQPVGAAGLRQGQRQVRFARPQHLLPEAASAGTERRSGKPAPADAPVDLSALRTLDAEIALRAGSWHSANTASPTRASRPSWTRACSRCRCCRPRPGAALDANALADARASRIAVKAVATGVNVNALLRTWRPRTFSKARAASTSTSTPPATASANCARTCAAAQR